MNKDKDQKRFEFQHKPSVCPVCHSKRIANILYGLPVFSVDLKNALAEGRITLGGCCVSLYDPKWQYKNYDTIFY